MLDGGGAGDGKSQELKGERGIKMETEREGARGSSRQFATQQDKPTTKPAYSSAVGGCQIRGATQLGLA